jgi:hypothetical protein
VSEAKRLKSLEDENAKLKRMTTSRAGLLPAANTKAQINPGLSLWLDERWGSGQLS